MSVTTAAAILAAGSGSRFGDKLPKQFVMLGDSPVLRFSVEAFAKATSVDAVYLIVPRPYLAQVNTWKAQYGWKHVTRVIAGGSDRAGSTLVALAAAEADGAQKLLLHDAARPLVAPEVIDAVVQALDTDAAVTAAVPAVDTTALADDAKAIADVPDRNRLWQIQTPQGFHTDVLRNAYALREQYPPIPATDDCGVVRAFLPEIPVRLVEGDRRCIKLTYPEDMTILSAFLAKEN